MSNGPTARGGPAPEGGKRVNALTVRFPTENLQVLAHFYRGELSRSNAWRQKMDITTNWAIITSSAAISVAFSEKSSPHLLLPFASFLAFLLLSIEGRRYRFYDVWRTRVRMLECHFLVPALCFEVPLVEGNWRQVLCDDLLLPTYKISYWEAIGRRLHRNYIWIFIMLILAWIVNVFWKAELAPNATGYQIYKGFGWEGVPAWLVLTVMGTLHLYVLIILITTLRVREATGEIRRKSHDRKKWPI